MRVQDSLATRFQITAARPGIGFLAMQATPVAWKAEERMQSDVIVGRQDQVEANVRFDPGGGALKVWMPDPQANHFLALNIREIQPDGSLVSVNDRSWWPVARRRTYQVATTDEPLVFRVTGPQLIRVDWLQDGQIWSERIPVASGSRTIVLPPRNGQTTTHYRIHEQVPNPTSRATPVAPLDPAPPTEQWVDDVVRSVYDQAGYQIGASTLDTWSFAPPDADIPMIDWSDSGWIGWLGQDTWSLSIGYRQRRALDEFPNPTAEGRFLETSLARDRYDRWTERYRRDQFLVRPRIEAGTTFGWRHTVAGIVPRADCGLWSQTGGWGPLHWESIADAFVQRAGTPRVPGANPTPWRIGWSGRLSRTHQIGESWVHRPSLSLFLRVLSEDFNGFGPGELDQDVFTTYKNNHRFGIRLANQTIWQPCLDRRWWIRPSLVTNEDQWVPDQINLKVATDQLVGPIQLHLGYRLTRFFADNDRSRSTIQNLLTAGMTWERWRDRRRRSEFAFSMRYDLDDRDASFVLGWTHFVNAGQGYRDLRSVPFRDLRWERAVQLLSPEF